MNLDEDHLPNHDPVPQSQSHSPQTLTLEIPAPQACDAPDQGPQKPQGFLEHTQMDEDVDPPPSTPKSPPITPHDGGSHTAVSRRGHKSKKPGMKWRGRGKKYQQKINALNALNALLDTFLKTFKPVPFIPAKALDFARHESLLKRLGLWEFVQVSFDRTLRSDLLAQLVTTFKKKERCSYVNEVRILVNRADLARALKLPLRKKERTSSGLEISLESTEKEESIGFLLDFVSNWVLLHDDMWIMPDNVLNWNNAIREGRFESLDWPDMMWFMVEKELTQGPALENCYYASHLQCLIRSQREELLREEVDVKDGDDDVKMVDLEEQSLELSLGHDNVDSADVDEKEGAASAEVGIRKEESFSAEKRDEEDESGAGREEDGVAVEEDGNVEAGMGEEEAEEADHQAEMENVAKEEEPGEQWFLDGQNETGEHFLRQCSFNNVGDIDMGYNMDKKTEGEGEEGEDMEEQEVEDEEGDDDDDDEEEQGDERGRFHMSENLNDLEGLSSANLIQVMDNNQMPFSSGVQICGDSCGEFLASSSRAETHLGPGGPSIYGNPNKREMDHSNGLLLNNGSNKRMRTEPLDFNTCSENALEWFEKMRMAHEAREQMWATSAMNQQILLNELQQRESMIEHLHKARAEDQQKMQHDIYRLERELHMMVGLLEGYRKALKESNRAFAEYRAGCPQLDEPLYRDVPGSGGLMLSVTELEKQRARREEEERAKLVIMKDRIKDFEAVWSMRFEAHLEATELLANKLLKIEEEMKAVKKLVKERKMGQEEAKESAGQEKAEESAVQEKAEDSAVQEKAEDSVAQEKAEDSVAQEKADDSVAQEKADDSVAYEKADDSVAQEKAEDSVVQEKAEESAEQKVEESGDQEMGKESTQAET
ncbi:hypothetical protein CDL15_Pgr001486 [Punica granatum]|uniref:Uncharacterized protein n=1 Tax=Punica granatum TaxID=22663 RepID=A0A218WMZ3_PUNGR|nr:hypothetical protein CDL15_Pgr001486 [Punica granatum]